MLFVLHKRIARIWLLQGSVLHSAFLVLLGVFLQATATGDDYSGEYICNLFSANSRKMLLLDKERQQSAFLQLSDCSFPTLPKETL